MAVAAHLIHSRVEIAERMSAADFWRLAPESDKADLIDGVMTVASPASDIHERLQIFLLALIRIYAEDHRLGEVRGYERAGVPEAWLIDT